MAITAISRDWGQDPAIVRITSTDTLATITTAGYIADQADNIAEINAGAFEWVVSDTVLVYASDGWGFYNISADFESLEPFFSPSELDLPSAQIIVGNASGIGQARAMTGVIAITNTGVTSIVDGSIVNADINAAAAIDFSKLAALPSAQILVGSAGNVATAVALSGDATISNVGALTIANNAITTAKILDANVTLGKLAAGITPSHVIKFASQVTTVGGAAAEAFSVPGAVGATDRAFVQVVDDGTANVTVLQAVVTDNTLTVTFSANPGNDAVINYQIIRAAS